MAKPYDKTTRRASAGLRWSVRDDGIWLLGDNPKRVYAIIDETGWSAWSTSNPKVTAFATGESTGDLGVAEAIEALTNAGVISAGDWE